MRSRATGRSKARRLRSPLRSISRARFLPVAKWLGEETELQFRTAPDEVGGIELSANGFKIAWTIAEYLVALEKRITALPVAPENNVAKTEAHVK